MKHHITLLIATAATMSLTMAAQTTWTYTDCVDYARTHNISLQKSQLSQQTSLYNLEEAEAQWMPTLDFATSHGYSNYPWRDGTKNSYNSSYGFNAGWTVWDGNQRENTIKQRRLDTEMSALATLQLQRTLDTDLLQVYLNILYARESIDIYSQAVDVSFAQADRARQLMEAGRLSRVDYARLQNQYEQDRYSLVNAQTTYNSRRMELKQLLELGIDTNITLATINWSTEQVMAALPPIDQSYALSVDTDPTLQSLSLAKESSALDVAIARGSAMPRISLNAGVGTGYSAPGQGDFATGLKRSVNESIGVTLSIPILDNKKSRMAVARAKVAQLDAQLDIDQRLTELSQNVENWYIEAQSAQARYTAAESQLTTTALTDELTNEQFRLGYVNTIELMTAHNDYIEAQHQLLQAKYMAILAKKMIEYYRTATITL